MPGLDQTPPHRLRQPPGLWVLCLTEMWERFSYYGMRALLVFYLTARLDDPENPGLGWSSESAGKLYGWYTGLVYLTPLLGGFLADKFLGTHRSMVLGGWILAAGHFLLAMTELFGSGTASVGTFLLGLLCIIIGTGFFKPCVSVMVGQLYSEDDPRRDSGFTFFYMGINVGATLAGLVAGTLGERVGWHYGFGAAGVGMVAGLLLYLFLRPRTLAGIGLPRKPHPTTAGTSPPLDGLAWRRIGVIFLLAFFLIFFWTGFEQSGTSMNVFALEKTDRTVADSEFPATWYQSVNPFFILVFAPVFAWLWVWLDRRGRQPSTPVKFGIGLLLLGLGFLFMVGGASRAREGEKAGPYWLVGAYWLHTWSELCLSPVGLSMVTRLAAEKVRSLMMGVWFLSNFVSNLLAGYLFAYKSTIESAGWFWGGEVDFYFLLVLAPAAAGLVVLALAPTIYRWTCAKPNPD